MNKLVASLIVLFISSMVSLSVPPADYPITIDSQSQNAPALQVYKGSYRNFLVTFLDGTNAMNLNGCRGVMAYKTNSLANSYYTSTWAQVSANQIRFTFDSVALNNSPTNYRYEVGVTDASNNLAIIREGSFLILPSAVPSGTAIPTSATSINWSAYAWVNVPNYLLTGDIVPGNAWTVTVSNNQYQITYNTNDLTAGAGDITAVTVSGGLLTGGGSTGSVNVALSTASVVAALSGLYATGTPIYGYTELDRTAGAAVTNLRADVNAFSGTVYSVFETKADTSTVASTYATTSRVESINTTSLARDGGISNTVLNLSGLVETNNTASIARDAGVSNAIALKVDLSLYSNELDVVRGYTNRAAQAAWSNLVYALDGITNNTPRNTQDATNAYTKAQLALMATSKSDQVSLQATGVYFNALNTVVVASANSRLASNTWNTAHTALVADVAVRLASNVFAVLDSTTNSAQRTAQASSNAAFSVQFSTVLPTSTWATADSTTNRVRRSGDTSIFQRVTSIIEIYGLAGNEMITNGTFTGGANWWQLNGFEYNSDKLVLNSGLSGSVSPSSVVSVVGGRTYAIAYQVGLTATSTITVTIGGATGTYAYAGTGGSVTQWLTTVNESNFLLTASTASGQLTMDGISVKQVGGSVLAGHDVVAGRYVRVGDDILIGSTGLNHRLSAFVPVTGEYRRVVLGGALVVTGQTVFGIAQTCTGSWSSIGGGIGNVARGEGAAVNSGGQNIATGDMASVSGGFDNIAGNEATTVGGGDMNHAHGQYAVIPGGYYNTANGYAATVSGGRNNLADGDYAVVGGAYNNTAGGQYAVVAGGYQNVASGSHGTLGGGNQNTMSAPYGALVGGSGNTISDSGAYSFIGGGSGNTIAAEHATIPGGNSCEAAERAFAWGTQAKALHQGAFVIADSNLTNYESTATDQFNARFENGYNFNGGALNGNAFGLTNLQAANIAAGGVLPALDGSGLTNLSAVSGDVFATNKLESLANVDAVAAPTANHVLTWNGAAWSNAPCEATITNEADPKWAGWLATNGAPVTGTVVRTELDTTAGATATNAQLTAAQAQVLATNAYAVGLTWIAASNQPTYTPQSGAYTNVGGTVTVQAAWGLAKEIYMTNAFAFNHAFTTNESCVIELQIHGGGFYEPSWDTNYFSYSTTTNFSINTNDWNTLMLHKVRAKPTIDVFRLVVE